MHSLRLATDLDLAKLNKMTSRARLEDVPSLATEILAGRTKGRVVIDINAPPSNLLGSEPDMSER
jgi:acrylyl-CoA reductase (NADPH)